MARVSKKVKQSSDGVEQDIATKTTKTTKTKSTTKKSNTTKTKPRTKATKTAKTTKTKTTAKSTKASKTTTKKTKQTKRDTTSVLHDNTTNNTLVDDKVNNSSTKRTRRRKTDNNPVITDCNVSSSYQYINPKIKLVSTVSLNGDQLQLVSSVKDNITQQPATNTISVDRACSMLRVNYNMSVISFNCGVYRYDFDRIGLINAMQSWGINVVV